MSRETKDSSIEIIGDIPVEWEVDKLSNICSIITDYVASGSFADIKKNVKYLDEPDYAMLVRTTDLSGSARSDKKVYISKHAYDFLSNSNLFGGEIILPNIGAVGDVYLVDKMYERMSLAPNSIMVKTKYIDKYYYYWFLSPIGRQLLLNLCQSTAQQKFNKTQLRNLRILVPTMSDQKKIVEYLDKKCKFIDSITLNINIILEKLKQYKDSLISETVTKGLDQKVTYKSCQIKSISEIPDDWLVQKMNSICNLITDYVASGSFADIKKNVKYLDEPDYALLVRTTDLSGSARSDKKVYINKHAYDFLSKSNLFGGEIILPNVGAVGDVYLLDKMYERMSLAPNSILIKTKYIDKYYYYWFKSTVGRAALKDLCQSTAQQKFNKTQFREMLCIVPPIKIQEDIVKYLDKECEQIDLLIQQYENLKNKIKDYKYSLIDESVTGKKEIN